MYCFYLCAVEVLDAVSLEERFRKALPMLTRQIEGLKLLQKTRKMSPDNENRVTNIRIFPFPFRNVCSYMPAHDSGCCPFRSYQCVRVECSQAGSLVWTRRMKMRMEMTPQPWRGRSTGPTCLRLHSEFVLKNWRGEHSPWLKLQLLFSN